MKALVSLLISENVRSPPLFKNQNSGRFSLCSYRVVQSRVFCWTSVDHRCNLCNIPLDAATFFFCSGKYVTSLLFPFFCFFFLLENQYCALLVENLLPGYNWTRVQSEEGWKTRKKKKRKVLECFHQKTASFIRNMERGKATVVISLIPDTF